MAVSLQDKVVLVTGGAGGMGKVICQQLAQQGATVIVGYNSSEHSAKELVTMLPPAAQPHSALAAPVTDSQALAELADQIANLYGRLDMVVNCAGTTRFVPHDDLNGLDDALIDSILATNVRGPFAVVRAMLPILKQSGAGLVVNISSIAAQTAMGSNVIYCASKAAMDNMTRSLARALAPEIRVVSVSPGLADTEFVKSMDQSWRDAQAAATPMNRLASPLEVADAVIAAATHLSFTTGAILPVDGGRPLS